MLDCRRRLTYRAVMHIERVPNRDSRPTILLRQSYREGKKVRKHALANLTRWPPQIVETLRQELKGQKLVPSQQAFTIERSIPHGHVQAVLGTIRTIGLDTLVAARRSRQRDLVVAMIAERLLEERPKLASARLWHTTTLPEELSVQGTDVDELHEAMDSFDTLLLELGTLCRNHGRIHADPSGTTFTQDTQPTELQARVFQLLGL